MRCGAALEVRDKRASGCMDNKGRVRDSGTKVRKSERGRLLFMSMDARTDWSRFEFLGMVGD